MKVIIAGGRDFNDYKMLCEKCDIFLQRWWGDIEIVSGCAEGADKLGMMYANERAIPLEKYPANWGAYGKYAGLIRNKLMADYADCLIAFWDGKSSGTKNMIEVATEKGLKIRVVNYSKFSMS